MMPRELFDVAVRVLGAFVLVWGLWDLVNAALFYTDYFRNPDMTFRFYLIFGWVSIFIGLLLIRSGGVLVNFAYPDTAEEDQDGSDKTSEADSADNG
jgi:hypothetical protein